MIKFGSAFLLFVALGGCTQSQEGQQAGAVRVGDFSSADQEIADRNVGFNVGQEYPWEINPSRCTALRKDPKSGRMMELAPLDAVAGDLGPKMEIVLFRHEDGPLKVPAGEFYEAQIYLDSIAYPAAGSKTVSISALPYKKYDYIVFTVEDTSREFGKALVKAERIEFQDGTTRVGFSMADTSNMLAKLDACRAKRLP
jgi:hypothetical protein